MKHPIHPPSQASQLPLFESATALRATMRIAPPSAIFASFLMAAAVFGLLPARPLRPLVAHAQNFSQRVIQGKVQADQGAVSGATVFLKDVKTRNLKSFTSTADGSFRFAQVGMVDDFEVWAEMGSKKSAVKTVSSFDSRKTVDVDLKLK